MSERLSKAIVRVLAPNGTTVGVGLLVGDRQIVTCAHVVASALTDPSLAYGEESPSREIKLQFPFVSQGKSYAARVKGWKPAQDDLNQIGEDGEDIAILELQGLPPSGVEPVPLSNEGDISGHSFKVFGYPKQHNSTGIWTEGVLSQNLPNQRIQIEGIKAQGVPIEPGFSGSPVWDEQLKGVVGIVVAADERHEVKVAFIIPTSVLRRAYQQLPIRRLPPEKQLQRLWRSRGCRTAIFSGIALTLFTSITPGNWLERTELGMYDHFTRQRPDEGQDDRILVIEVNEEDRERWQGGTRLDQASLPEEAYKALFDKLEEYEPVTIGLDIYRKSAVPDGFDFLRQQFKDNSNLYFICNIPGEKEPKGNAPPPEVRDQIQRLGFSDFPPDNGDVIRRQFIWMKSSEAQGKDFVCSTDYAFSFRLAINYLEQTKEDFEWRESLEKDIEFYLNGNRLPQLDEPPTGGYSKVDSGGFQVLLKYRTHNGSTKDFVDRVSLSEFLNSSNIREELKNRIVLIGNADSKEDTKWLTPYGYDKRTDSHPGVLIHAQMTSQLLSVALDERTLITPLNYRQIGLWLLGWFIAGNFIVWFLRSRILLTLVATGVMLISLYGVSRIALVRYDIWLPIVSPSIALTIPVFVGLKTYNQFQIVSKKL